MALGDLVGISTNQGVRAYDNGDGTFSLQVQTTPGIQTTTVITKYTVSTAFAVPAPGGALNDTVESVATYNSVTGALLSTVWLNLTQGTTLAGAPTPADLTLQPDPTDPFGTQFFSYTANAGSAGVNVGDVVQRSVSTDLVNGGTVDNWYNITTGLFLATAPAAANLTPITVGKSYVDSTFTYTVTTGFAGASVGDILANVVILDPSTVPPTAVSNVWYNISQGTTLGAAPSYANIDAGTPTTPVLPQKTADMIYATGAGSTPAGAIQVSFANVGTGPAIIGASLQSIPPGATLDFQAASGGSIASITYDATGTTLLVATLA